jgi:hypothetical protein
VSLILNGTSNWSLLAESVIAAAMIAMLAANPDIGKIARLTNRVLRCYGRISYSFYLLHPSLLVILEHARTTDVGRANGDPTDAGQRVRLRCVCRRHHASGASSVFADRARRHLAVAATASTYVAENVVQDRHRQHA